MCRQSQYKQRAPRLWRLLCLHDNLAQHRDGAVGLTAHQTTERLDTDVQRCEGSRRRRLPLWGWTRSRPHRRGCSRRLRRSQHGHSNAPEHVRAAGACGNLHTQRLRRQQPAAARMIGLEGSDDAQRLGRVAILNQLWQATATLLAQRLLAVSAMRPSTTASASAIEQHMRAASRRSPAQCAILVPSCRSAAPDDDRIQEVLHIPFRTARRRCRLPCGQ